MPEFCKVEKEGRLLIVTIDRPEVMNAIHPPASAELSEIWDEFDANPELAVAILTGAGDRAFSAGNDLKYSAADGPRDMQPASGLGGNTTRFDTVKPTIAAVNGIAMGGGFEMALACDIIIAAERALFALPEPRVGLAAMAGGVHRLARMIPLKHAMGMVLTARRVPAREGLELGFVNEVVPNEELMTVARRWASEILEGAPLSVRASKQAMMQGLNEPSLQAALEAQSRYEYVRKMYAHPDVKEGPLAFSQKRKPNWTGW